jgi:Tol biopolymer transport system component
LAPDSRSLAAALRALPRLAPSLSAALSFAIAFALTALGPLAAEAQFGKNKVQYDKFDFKTLETEHFLIYFYPEEERSIYDAARMAERAYGRLSRVFNHTFTDKKPIIIYASHSDFQQTNIFDFEISEGTGGITEGLRDRVVLPFTGSMKEFDHVLTHELTHSFQYDIMRLGALSRGANPFSNQPPLWFMEGMAEYLSLGDVGPLSAMWLRDGSLTGYLPTLTELSYAQDIRVYRYGQAILYFIGKKFGDEKIGEIMQKVPIVGFQEAVASSLSLSVDELSAQWLESVRRTYFPSIARYARAQDVGKRLTDHDKEKASFNLAPALSPDGKQVAFLSDRNYFQDLFLADAETGKVKKKLVSGNRTESFETLRFLSAGLAFSHDGQYLAFTAKAGAQDALYVMRLKGTKIVGRFRFKLEGVLTPSWSPDDSKIVFAGLDGGATDLFIVDRNGQNLRRLTDDTYMERDPVFSPDGRQIAFTTDRGPETDLEKLAFGQSVIGIYDVDQGSIKLLPEQSGKNINPQWSPDGKAIAYISDRTGISNIFLQTLEGPAQPADSSAAPREAEAPAGTVYQLTNLLTGVTGIVEAQPAFSWSADGSAIVFSGFDRAGWDLYRIDDPRQLAVAPFDTTNARRGPLELVIGGPFANVTLPVPETDKEKAKREKEREETPTSQLPARSVYIGGLRGAPAVADSTQVADRQRVRAPGESVDVAALLGDPSVSLPDTSRFAVRDYKIKLQPDVVARPRVGYIEGSGAYGGSTITFSDILGNHQLGIAAAIYGDVTESDIFLQYISLARRTNWGVSVFQFRYDFNSLFTGAGVGNLPGYMVRSDIYRGAQFFLSRPSNRFRRWEVGVEATYVDQRVVQFDFFDLSGDVVGDLGDEFYVSPIVAHVFDNTLFGSTGPVQGTRYRLDLQRPIGDRNYTQILTDFRKYWKLPGPLTLAQRALYIGNFGDFNDIRVRSFGGATLFRGFEYNDGRLIGNQLGLLNTEVRFPILESPRIGPVIFPPIHASLFFDTAFGYFSSCPDNPLDPNFAFCESRSTFQPFRSDPEAPLGFRLNDLRGAYGFGLATNLFGFAIVRASAAWLTDLAGTGPTQFQIVLAPEF